MKILVFLHGTILMQAAGAGRTRKERVQQVEEGEPSVSCYESYIPVGNAAEKLQEWKRQGVEITYLSSRGDKEKIEIDHGVLRRFGFPEGRIYFREAGKEYAEIVARVMPDLFIEDDCESIGGRKEMTSPHLQGEAKRHIRVIVVKEFGGINDLPDSFEELERFCSSFHGLLLKESLRDVSVLDTLQIENEEQWNVPRATDDQPKKWTAVFFRGDVKDASRIAAILSTSLRERSWYANLSTPTEEFVIFPHRVFRYKKGDVQAVPNARIYGKSLGIPEHQLVW